MAENLAADDIFADMKADQKHRIRIDSGDRARDDDVLQGMDTAGGYGNTSNPNGEVEEELEEEVYSSNKQKAVRNNDDALQLLSVEIAQNISLQQDSLKIGNSNVENGMRRVGSASNTREASYVLSDSENLDSQVKDDDDVDDLEDLVDDMVTSQ